MERISLDAQDEVVKRFVMDLATNLNGSVLEMAGRAIAYVMPTSKNGDQAPQDEDWSEAKNQRRCELIDRKYAGRLNSEESIELAVLQEQMLRYRQRVAPLPLEDARRLHQELLTRAAQTSANK